MKSDRPAERIVREFYDGKGWDQDSAGTSTDAQLWEDLRECARDYVAACRLKLLEHLPPTGERLLDAASGPIQYPEYLEYSKGFSKRFCVDISQKALDQARLRLGDRGEYVCASILKLPFPDEYFDAVVSLHTIYHIDRDEQEKAVRQLLRVARPGSKVVVVYANPDRLAARFKRLFKPTTSTTAGEDLYYFAHPLSWWKRFSDEANVDLFPWRSLTAQDARRIVPDNLAGRTSLKAILMLERHFPRMFVQLGAYPLVVLTRKPA